jgi:hypothetical protein
VLAHARTAQGVVFQLRKDPMGVPEVPGLENVLISIHVGLGATPRGMKRLLAEACGLGPVSG